MTQRYALSIVRSSQAHFPFVVGEYFIFDRVPEVEAFIATAKSIHDSLLMLDYLPMIIQSELVTGFSIEGEHVVLSFDI
ncbi:hypothetical protein SAMN05216213_103417 [Ectopseudomonas guguanensis]|uniref:Uncharacterized protein n=2 Tax=Ectopseudomonas guguanensis TaxID=1198456 RepID=A0A1H0S3Z3_9GAMM|nr:hypothetical protein SAMN05216213_103417 [Pseudomonas guguanensis]